MAYDYSKLLGRITKSLERRLAFPARWECLSAVFL